MITRGVINLIDFYDSFMHVLDIHVGVIDSLFHVMDVELQAGVKRARIVKEDVMHERFEDSWMFHQASILVRDHIHTVNELSY